jgi:UDP-N-acetylglucosamine--N-acetylmuramyl-(pentapeptide) pyrophosphoryl-undecaprenol N-acetylglucosamine transferase
MLEKTADAGLKNIHLREFIREMDLAYAAADVIVSRAGALSVSELSLVGKPVIFIPSPNVAEDHQTKNAMAYVNHDAAWLLKDNVAVGKLKSKLDELMTDPSTGLKMGLNIKSLAKPDAAIAIRKELEKLVA